jgi:hypothetical protein
MKRQMGSLQAARPEKVRSRPLTSRISLTFHLCTKPTSFFNIFVNLNPFLNYFIRKVPILHQPFCQNHSFLSPSPQQACIYPTTKGDDFFQLMYLCVFVCHLKNKTPLVRNLLGAFAFQRYGFPTLFPFDLSLHL